MTSDAERAWRFTPHWVWLLCGADTSRPSDGIVKLEAKGAPPHFRGEADRWHGALYGRSSSAREAGLRGIAARADGYGASRIRTAKVLQLSEDLPIVIEIADLADRIEAFLPVLDEMVANGLVTLERVQVITYRPGK